MRCWPFLGQFLKCICDIKGFDRSINKNHQLSAVKYQSVSTLQPTTKEELVFVGRGYLARVMTGRHVHGHEQNPKSFSTFNLDPLVCHFVHHLRLCLLGQMTLCRQHLKKMAWRKNIAHWGMSYDSCFGSGADKHCSVIRVKEAIHAKVNKKWSQS